MNEKIEAIKSSILDSLDKAKTALNNKEVSVQTLKVSEIPGYIRQIELNKIKLTVNCSEFESGTIKATKDGKERTGTVQGGQCIIMLPSTGTWHIEHDLGDYIEVEVNGDTSTELVKKKVTFSEGDCSEEKITIHVDSVTGNNSNDNFIRVKKNGVIIEVQAQLKGSDIEITNFEFEDGATYTIEYVIKDEVRGSIEVELIISKESVKLKAEFIGTGMESEIGALSRCENVKNMIFTDEKAPDDVTTYDKSASNDNSVVAWFKDETLYISSQIKGAKIEMFNCYYNDYDDYLSLTKESKNHTYRFNNLKNIDLYNIDSSKMTNMSNMFTNAPLETINNLDKLDTHLVTDMSSMFDGTNISNFDLSNFDTSNVKTMHNMFGSSKSSELTINGLDAQNVNDFSSMFSYSESTTIKFTNLKIDKLTTMEQMFGSCSNLKEVDLSEFDIKNVENLNAIFYGCPKLQSVQLGDNFKSDKLSNANGMFWNCSVLPEIDLSNFIIPDNNVDVSMMFNGCRKLQTIYANEWNASNVSKSDDMFTYCSLLPNYKSSKVDISMAKWKENGGYFTNPAEKV